MRRAPIRLALSAALAPALPARRRPPPRRSRPSSRPPAARAARRRRRRAGHPGGDRHAARGRQRRRRGGRGRRRARRDRAVLVRHRRRRLHGHPHAERQGHHDRLRARRRRRAMQPDSFFENGAPLRLRRRALQRPLGRRAGTVARWDEALDRYGTHVAAQGAAPGIAVARDGFTVDQTFFDQTTRQRTTSTTSRRTAAIYLDPDGTPRDVGTHARNPDLAKTYRCIARVGAPPGFYRGPVARRDGRPPRRTPPIAADANHTWRPGLMTSATCARYTRAGREPTAARYRGLDVYGMGPPSSGGSTVGEALNILEGSRRAARYRDAGRCTTTSRRRATRSPTATPTWRPGLRRRPAARAALGPLRRRARAR